MKTLRMIPIIILIFLAAFLAVRADSLVWTPPVADPAPETNGDVVITKFDEWNPYTYAFAVEAGQATEEEIIEELDAANCYAYGSDGSGARHEFEIKWTASGTDMTKAGVFKITGEPVIADGFSVAAGTETPHPFIPVSIQEKGKPQLNVFHTARAGSYTFPWVEPPCDPEEMTVWISEDGGEWTELEHDDCISVFKTNLVLYGFLLKDGSSYRLQADYTGGRTNMFSFTFDKNIVEYNFSGGDRDGGDLDAAAPPEVEQPVGDEDDGVDDAGGDAPVVDTPVIGTESSAAASAAYTGKRIDFMRGGEGGISVSRSTFDLEIPKETLDALAVGKNDTLSVSVTRGENGEITVALAKNGQPVDDAGPLTLSIPYESGQRTEPPLLLDSGVKIAANPDAQEENMASFTVSGPGTYTLDESGGKAAPNESQSLDLANLGALAMSFLSVAAYAVHKRFI
ncbi:hypothetical protein [Cloacibacillus evryensis]|uniref:hypothetical protein n=1 Tax=Cloacibacillus evryensis TaxID=508460 RepID=UPI0004473C49|nr:hypothetical protein [Cloacibacillus evryensis]EXG77939.1 hypothetical protein Cloev_0033 [Cloacibacillus evryensis DSM 19522]